MVTMLSESRCIMSTFILSTVTYTPIRVIRFVCVMFVACIVYIIYYIYNIRFSHLADIGINADIQLLGL